LLGERVVLGHQAHHPTGCLPATSPSEPREVDLQQLAFALVAVDVWSLLLGAGLTLGSQATIQIWVIPKVEAGKRRADRWERNVLTLGELLTLSFLS
jgi:hypothetical protein